MAVVLTPGIRRVGEAKKDTFQGLLEDQGRAIWVGPPRRKREEAQADALWELKRRREAEDEG